MKQETLSSVVIGVIKQLRQFRLTELTVRNYEQYFKRLKSRAVENNQIYYTPELGRLFLSKDSVSRTSNEQSHVRYCYCLRCIRLIESYLRDGQIDISATKNKASYEIKSGSLRASLKAFSNAMDCKCLKFNTRDGYERLVKYFLLFIEDKGYASLAELQAGDVVCFIALICQEHYQPTSLGSHLPGLKMFLDSDEASRPFIRELPGKIQKKKAILEVYSDEEMERVAEYIGRADISSRNKAIYTLAIETGLRAVDICGIKLSDIDWEHDRISICQEKTGKPLTMPLRESFGNHIFDYLMNERPHIDSEHLFLRSHAPYAPLSTHAACYRIISEIIADAGIKQNGRISGTRMTRHTMASRQLRKGVPLPVISQSLGHANPNSTMRYISTDNERLAGLALPLPGKGSAR